MAAESGAPAGIPAAAALVTTPVSASVTGRTPGLDGMAEEAYAGPDLLRYGERY